MKKIILITQLVLLCALAQAQPYIGKLPVTLGGIPATATGVQWYKDGSPILGANASTYEANSSGNYYAEYTDASTVCTADASVLFVLLDHGASLTLDGNTNNSTGTNYQWYADNAAISGAITSNYTTSTGGLYNLKYNNGTCQIESRSYYVFVLNRQTYPDFGVTNLNMPSTGNLSTNDDVPAGTTYGTAVANPGNPAGANLTINANGTYSFQAPTAGVYTYQVPVCAPGQTVGCPTETLTFTVVNPNVSSNMPSVNTDIAATEATNPVVVNVLANDLAGNLGGTLNPGSVTIVNPPTNGTVSVNPSTGAITYTANPGFVGTETITYQVCDNSTPAPLCSSGSLSIAVNPESSDNNAPVGADDFVSASIGASASGNVLLNDTDPEGGVLSTTPQNIAIPGAGTFVLNSNGAYTFTPLLSFSGSLEIPYEVCDNGSPSLCKQATLHILATPQVVLPVLWSNVELKSKECAIEVQWTTTKEENVSHFIVKRRKSTDVGFNEVAKIDAKGNSGLTQAYTFVDNDLVSGVYYYQIQSVDIDGQNSLTPVYSHHVDCATSNDMTVWPNPATDQLNVKFNSSIEGTVDIDILDMSGRVTLTHSYKLKAGVSHSKQLDVSMLSEGSYQVRMIHNGEMLVQKFVKKNK